VFSENRGSASDGSANADDIDIKRDAPRREKASFKSALAGSMAVRAER